MFNEVKTYDAEGNLKRVISGEELSLIHWASECGEFNKVGEKRTSPHGLRTVKEKTCWKCGKKFLSPNVKAKFCHKPCTKLYKPRVKNIAKCKECSSEFEKHRSNHVLCSDVCRKIVQTRLMSEKHFKNKISGGENGVNTGGNSDGRN